MNNYKYYIVLLILVIIGLSIFYVFFKLQAHRNLSSTRPNLRTEVSDLSSATPTPLPTIIPCENLNDYTEIEGISNETKDVCYLNLNKGQADQIITKTNKLNKLQGLSLSGHGLTELPSDVWKLENLLFLYIDNNKLTTLPSGISNLYRLRVLNISNNYLSQVPNEIGKLTSLIEINLSNNPLPQAEKDRIKKLLPNTNITF